MQFDWNVFLMALGLAFVLEGLPYFLFAERMPLVLRTMAEQRPAALRLLGLTAMALGLALVFVVRG
jgi:hypothetical protein